MKQNEEKAQETQRCRDTTVAHTENSHKQNKNQKTSKVKS